MLQITIGRYNTQLSTQVERYVYLRQVAILSLYTPKLCYEFNYHVLPHVQFKQHALNYMYMLHVHT